MGVTQLQILRNEFQINQATTPHFDCPWVIVALASIHAVSHVKDFAHQLIRIPLFAQHRIGRRNDLFTQIFRTIDRTQAGQRHMFPCPCVVVLIGIETFEMGRKRAF